MIVDLNNFLFLPLLAEVLIAVVFSFTIPLLIIFHVNKDFTKIIMLDPFLVDDIDEAISTISCIYFVPLDIMA